MHDYHVHSTYSDGTFLEWMIDAAAAAGLSGVGFADHCSVIPTESARRHRERMGFNLDQTYERRRAAIQRQRADASIAVFDAVEMDYEPEYEDAIESFLSTAGFDYAVGSVHELEAVNVHREEYFAGRSQADLQALVDRYFEKLIALIDSELFEIVAHADLVERNPVLRGYATQDHYDRVAAAFADSRSIPEINAGRVTDDYGEFHPAPAFLDTLCAADTRFVVGSDSHDPGAIAPRIDALRAEFDDRGLTPVTLDGLV